MACEETLSRLLINILLHLVRRPPHPTNPVDGGRPRVHGLPAPHPEPRRDPNGQDHEVLEHQNREIGGGSTGGTVGAEQGPLPPEKSKN